MFKNSLKTGKTTEIRMVKRQEGISQSSVAGGYICLLKSDQSATNRSHMYLSSISIIFLSIPF